MITKNPHAVALSLLVRNHRGGRPPILRACLKCGQILSTRQLRRACPEHKESKQ